MNIMQMKKKDSDAVPWRESWDSDIPLCDSIVIIPSRRKHDSGFRCMSFVCCKGFEPIVRTYDCSDVINIDGIGGYGDWWKDGAKIPKKVEPKGWSIDCLPCGYLRLFANLDCNIKVGESLSSFEVFGKKVKRRGND